MAGRGRVAGLLTVRTGALVGLAVVAVFTAPAPGSSAEQAQPVAATPELAVAAVVTAGGQQYAGPCEETRSPEDIGKVCAQFADQREDMRAFLIGRTFSEFDRWVFIAPAPSGWATVAVEPLDFYALSPAIPWPHER